MRIGVHIWFDLMWFVEWNSNKINEHIESITSADEKKKMKVIEREKLNRKLRANNKLLCSPHTDSKLRFNKMWIVRFVSDSLSLLGFKALLLFISSFCFDSIRFKRNRWSLTFCARIIVCVFLFTLDSLHVLWRRSLYYIWLSSMRMYVIRGDI